MKNCTVDYIKSIVHGQIKKKSESYTQHHISNEVSRKIIDKLVNDGVDGAMSAILVITSPIETVVQKPIIKILSKSKRQRTELEDKKQSSLTYLGNRKSFVKSIEPGSR